MGFYVRELLHKMSLCRATDMQLRDEKHANHIYIAEEDEGTLAKRHGHNKHGA